MLLVTGATGHVGLAVARTAARQGLDVLALSHTRAPGEVDAATPRVRWERCDLGDAAAVARLAAAHPIAACIHGAAVSNEAHARPDPHRAIAANVGATAHLLEAARVHGWRRFLLVSTGSVFQLRADTVSPIREDEPPAPRNVYGTTKAAAELLVRMYRTELGLSASAIRISWVFGPPVVSREPTRGPIPSYLVRALNSEAIREGGGDFAASFTYVADVAQGLVAAALAPVLNHDVYHLGHGVNFTARAAADAVRAAVPGAVIELGPGSEPWTRYTSLRGPLAGTRLEDDTSFRPSYTLAAAVAEYADWLKAHPRAWQE